jgi:multidrug transporter EmrE-like cation transporter
MTFSTLALLITAAIGNAAGSSLIKYAAVYKAGESARTAIYYLLFTAALALYGGTFPLFAIALGRTRLSIAQPVFSATSYVTVIALSLLLFREPLVATRIVGIAVIIVGVVLVAR